MPTRSPLVLTSAPPLLPGLTAASVCINDSIPCLSRILILLALALTIPAVTVDCNRNGLPTARTHSPICSESEFPNTTNGN